MVKAAQLADGDQEAEVPPQDAAHPGQGVGITVGVQLDGSEGVVQNPPIQEEQTVDPKLTSGVVLVEDKEDLAGSGVPIAGGAQNESTATQGDAATQEDDPARLQIPAVEGTQSDVEADGSRVEAAGQGEHPEEEKDEE